MTATDASTRASLPRRIPVGDAVLSVVLVALLPINLVAGWAVRDDVGEVTALTYVFTVAPALAIAFRSVAPLLTVAVIAVLQGAQLVVGGPIQAGIVCLWIALYTVSIQRDRRTALIVFGWLGLVIGVLSMVFRVVDQSVLERIGALGLTVIPLLVGDAVRSRRAAMAEMTEKLELAEATREREAQRRVQHERLRIARDLHDVVAHSIATINVQAGVAAHVIDAQPDVAKQALVDIKQASRTALAELRATLTVLREGDEPATPTEPSPGLDRIATLVERHGPTATLHPQGSSPRSVDPAVGVAGYRIVQEALTNVMKHSQGSRVEVRVRYRNNQLEITVVDDGTGRPGETAASGSGMGLQGLRERAASVGGRLSAGPLPTGGFRVAATLPYSAATPLPAVPADGPVAANTAAPVPRHARAKVAP